MKVYNLGSSSKGNCYVFKMKTNEHEEITFMLECGFSIKDIQRKMIKYGLSLTTIEFCLITHGHHDHCESARELIAKGIPVYQTKGTAQIVHVSNTEFLEPLKSIVIDNGQIIITPFEVKHDIDGAVGFIIESSKEKILFVNDCKYFDCDLSMFQFDYVFIECNYETKQTYTIYNKAKKENDYLKIKQYGRVINAHMGLYTTIKQLAHLDLSNCKGIFLMHLSDGNANEHIMKATVEHNTNCKTYVCKRDGGMI